MGKATFVQLPETLAIAVGLGADAMSVCMGVGVRYNGPAQTARLMAGMGLFQAIMPVLGWYAGRNLAGVLAHYGGYVGAGLLFLVGLKMFQIGRAHV